MVGDPQASPSPSLLSQNPTFTEFSGREPNHQFNEKFPPMTVFLGRGQVHQGVMREGRASIALGDQEWGGHRQGPAEKLTCR